MELTDTSQLDHSAACIVDRIDAADPHLDLDPAFLSTEDSYPDLAVPSLAAYHPDDAQYAHNKLTFVGTRISHLPSALFELLHELMRRYGNSGRCVFAPKELSYHKEGHSWYAWEDDSYDCFAPECVVLELSAFSDSQKKNVQYLSVEMSTVRFRAHTMTRSGAYIASCRADTDVTGRTDVTVNTDTAGGMPGKSVNPRETFSFRGGKEAGPTTSYHQGDRKEGMTSAKERQSFFLADEKLAAEGFRQLRKWLAAARTAPRRSSYQEYFQSGVPGGIMQAALVLRINGTLKSRYYFTAKRFMNANRGKYCLPGMNAPVGRTWRVCVFDTEMERPYPIQFAGVLLEKTAGAWSVLDRFSTYIRMPAGTRLSRDVARVTKITDERLRKEGIPEREADEKIQAFLARADLLCGHAVLADKEIMRTSFMRQQLRLPYSLRRHEMIDTQLILERLFGLDNAVKLEYAAELAGVRREEDVFHDARTDAEVTARLLAALEPDFVEKYQTEPVVCDAMMHAPQQTQLLSRLQG